MSWNIQRTPHATKRRQTLAWITLLICIKFFFSDAKSNSSIVNLFFQAPARWSPNVLQFLASMVHLGQFVYELLNGFLVLEWAPIFESKEVSSLSSGVCHCFSSAYIGRNKMAKIHVRVSLVYWTFNKLVQRVSHMRNIIITIMLSFYSIISYYYCYSYANDDGDFIKVSKEVWRRRKKPLLLGNTYDI